MSSQVSRGNIMKSEVTYKREDENECIISTSILGIQRLDELFHWETKEGITCCPYIFFNIISTIIIRV